jgi:hypothetical protein
MTLMEARAGNNKLIKKTLFAFSSPRKRNGKKKKKSSTHAYPHPLLVCFFDFIAPLLKL